MSFNRENIVWQSADGTWNRGFWRVVWTGEGDPEWDVEYGDDFEWVTTGHPDVDSTMAAWDGANPGGFDELSHTAESADRCHHLDTLAEKCKANGVRDRWVINSQVWTDYH